MQARGCERSQVIPVGKFFTVVWTFVSCLKTYYKFFNSLCICPCRYLTRLCLCVSSCKIVLNYRIMDDRRKSIIINSSSPSSRRRIAGRLCPVYSHSPLDSVTYYWTRRRRGERSASGKCIQWTTYLTFTESRGKCELSVRTRVRTWDRVSRRVLHTLRTEPLARPPSARDDVNYVRI